MTSCTACCAKAGRVCTYERVSLRLRREDDRSTVYMHAVAI